MHSHRYSRLWFPIILLMAACTASAPSGFAADSNDTAVYELRTYTTLPGRLDALLERFRAHTIRLFEKHGMRNVGYWVPTDADKGAGHTLIYLLRHASRDAATASWKAFNTDPEWKQAKAASEAGGRIVAKVVSVFLQPTDYSSSIDAGAGKQDRVFELRTYHTTPGNLSSLDARFRNHTRAFFTKHGMTNLAYFHPVDADKGAGGVLVYFLAHASRAAATASWDAFRADPGWIAAKAASEKAAGGSLTVPDGVSSIFLQPTDFSAIR